MSHLLSYLFFGAVSNTALKVYMIAPRSWIQSEALSLHRWALKRAHAARMGDSDAYVPDGAVPHVWACPGCDMRWHSLTPFPDGYQCKVCAERLQGAGHV